MMNLNVSGLFAGLGMTLITAGWVIATRLGFSIDLSVHDLLALRLLVACLICAPVLFYLNSWRGLSISQYAILASLGGIPHILLGYEALERTSVALFSAFLYGMTPIATALASYLFLRRKVNANQMVGILIILIGIVLLSYEDFSRGINATAWFGNVMAFASIALFAAYMVFAERWKVTISQSITACTVLNGMVYLPVWLLTTDYGFSGIATTDLVVHGLIQGLIPGVLMLLLITIATRSIGADLTALFFALIPVVSASLAVLVLNEYMTAQIMIGVLLTTCGISIASVRLKARYRVQILID